VAKRPIFTVDWESYYSAVDPYAELDDDRIAEPTYFLLELLNKFEVKAIFYVLGHMVLRHRDIYRDIKREGHTIGWHGMRHKHDLTSTHKLFRSPYWDESPMPSPPSGGFFFRYMAYPYVRWAVKKSGTFWIHPHDLDEGHPKLKNRVLNWKRHIGLDTAREKLDTLLSEVEFG